MSGGKPLVVNGWTIDAHPLFLDQLEALIAHVERQKCCFQNDFVENF